jgi:hypothetical protein
MSWLYTTIIASIAGCACAVGLSEYIIARRRGRHVILLKRYDDLPKQSDSQDVDIDWDDTV